MKKATPNQIRNAIDTLKKIKTECCNNSEFPACHECDFADDTPYDWSCSIKWMIFRLEEKLKKTGIENK